MRSEAHKAPDRLAIPRRRSGQSLLAHRRKRVLLAEA